jgi:hypothetical protein
MVIKVSPVFIGILLWNGALPVVTRGQEPPPIRLKGRESVVQLKAFEPFLGFWQRVESPVGTALPDSTGGCLFQRSSHGITIEWVCGPPGQKAGETTTVFWHPTEKRLIYRMYSIRFPQDLLFEGTITFPSSGTLQQVYQGFYADGRILTYRETKTIGSDGRMRGATEQLIDDKWTQIFGGSIYVRGDQSDRQIVSRQSTVLTGGRERATHPDSTTAWREHLTFLSRDGGTWITSNSAYRTDANEEPHAYAMHYRMGFGGTVQHGCLWGVSPGRPAAVFWHYFTAWNPVQGSLLVQQSGANGVIGIGYESPQSGVAEQTFAAPDGSRWDVRHVSERHGADSLVTTSFQRTTGDWERRRSYKWTRQANGTTPPCQ